MMGTRFFEFHHPWILLTLLFLPLLFRFWKRGGETAAIGYSSSELFGNSRKTWRERLVEFMPWVKALALTLLITALARPQLGNHFSETLTEGIDIMLTLDTSGSMKALDFHMKGDETTRLDVVKSVVDGFIARRTNDRVGMVVFGEQAFTQCPLTRDMDTLRGFLKYVHIGMAGDGTAVGTAIGTAVKRLKNQPTKSKVIILLTDGRSNAGSLSPGVAAQTAAAFNIKIYTIGVGSRGKIPYIEDTPLGPRRVYADLDLDEETLRFIAEQTGGRYFRATDTEELEGIYSEIDRLEKTPVKVREFNDYEELYLPFLLAGLFLLMTETVLVQTLLLRIP